MTIEEALRGLGLLLGGGAVGAVLRTFFKPSSKAEITEVVSRVTSDMIKNLWEEIERLKAENIHCRQENDQLTQRMDSMERVMRKAGLPMPDGSEFWELRPDGEIVPKRKR